MPPENKKTDDQNKENPQNNELQKALQALQEQNKILQTQIDEAKKEKEAQAKKLEEDKKAREKKELEDNSDLGKLLKGLEELSDEDDDNKKKSGKSVDSLSNEELIGVIGETVEKFVEAKFKLDKEERAASQDGFLKKVGNIEQMLGSMMAMQSVNDLRVKYPDFNEYKQEIAVLLKETPGISIERAYKLAKAERLEKEPPRETVDTEIPNIGPSGLPAIPERKDRSNNRQENVSTGGVAAFRSFLADGIGRALANRHKQS